MKKLLITLHVVAAAMLVFALQSGPPMGESEVHPWDYYSSAALITFLVLCSVGYLALWKKEAYPKSAGAVSIASALAATCALAFGAFHILH